MNKRVLIPLTLLVLSQSILWAGFSDGGPQPGDVYKEYVLSMTNKNWRITDPGMDTVRHPAGASFLPNPVHTLTIDDLNNATRAEIVIDFWAGHEGTTDKKFRFNGRPWISIPDLVGNTYMQQVNHLIPVPLSDLVPGVNRLEGTCGPNGWDWGQWGWYGVIVRVYYESSKPHATGQIAAPLQNASFGENPVVTATTSGSANRVDFVAYYDGYDTDGDGVYLGWHRDYHRESWNTPMGIRNHIGTDNSAPFAATWNTNWVPDQASGAIRLVARIRDGNGYWFVSPAVTGLSLSRPDLSVRLYKASGVPIRYWVRNNQTKSSTVNIASLDAATAAIVHVATWNGNDLSNDFFSRVNNQTLPKYGANHFYSYDEVPVPLSALRTGNNTVTFHSTTIHHGIEIMWPGPAVSVRYGSSAPPPPPPPPPPDPDPSDDLVANGGFESGMASWTFYTNGTGSASASGSPPPFEGAQAVTINTNSSASNIQLYQYGLVLEPNTNYRLTFAAYSSVGRDLRVTLAKHVSPFTNYGVNKVRANLTTGWQVFTIDFKTKNFSKTVADGRLYFWFASDAKAGDQYYIDEVSLTKR